MSYGDFTLVSVKKIFNLTFKENVNLFAEVKELTPSDFVLETLRENTPLALASNTEKARSELIITPILVELRKQLHHQISIFSGVSFNVDPTQGLNGNCDFLISKSTELLMITAPVIILVEAKKEDLNTGLGQCIAEMIAAQFFNQRENNYSGKIYGCITSGTNWRFLFLEDSFVYLDLTEYYLKDLGKILGILANTIV
jgi:hypothetical protein